MARNLANEGHEVTLISKDLPMRIKASAVGLDAEEYRGEQVHESDARLDRHGRGRGQLASTSTSCTTTRCSTSTTAATCPATPAWC